MARISQTRLPGVGVRYDLISDEGQRLGVIHHRTGRREVFICPPDDPDSPAASISLGEDDAHSLVDMLGGSQVVENLSHMTQHIEGLAIDWLSVDADSKYASATIGDARIRTRTGVSVVAVLRGDEPYPAPGPEFELLPEDVLVVVGTAEGVEKVTEILKVG